MSVPPSPPRSPLRVLFVNSGFLGHRSVSRLLADVVAGRPDVLTGHLNLSDGLTRGERVIRRVLCQRLAGRTGYLNSNLDLVRYRAELNGGVLAWLRIRAWERAHGPADVLHFHTQATAYLGLARMARTRSIVSIDCTQGLAKLEAANRLERLTYWPNEVHDRAVFRRAAAVTCTSEWAAADFRSAYPESAAKLRVLPYPVRLDLFEATWAEQRAATRRRDPGAPTEVLFVGGDFPRKGGPELLRAWGLGGVGQTARLTLITDWPIPPKDLPPGVRHIRRIEPYSDDWREVWRQADVFVLPTRGEAFGMVFQEAAAAGLPAVGTRLNAVPEIVRDGTTGLLVTPGDVPELTAALRRLCADPGLRERMGRTARARAEAEYHPAGYGNALCGLIAEVAGG